MLLSMALQAALHRNGDGLPDDGTCHRAHVAVADGALKLGLGHMAPVRKVHMSGKPVDLLPGNFLTALRNLLELRLYFGQPWGLDPYSGVAFQAVVHGGDPSEGLALGVHMAGGTRQFSREVLLVIKRDGRLNHERKLALTFLQGVHHSASENRQSHQQEQAFLHTGLYEGAVRPEGRRGVERS